jgi:hypothetical protein
MPLKKEELRHLRAATGLMYRTANGRIAVNPYSGKGRYGSQWNANPRTIADLKDMGLLTESEDGKFAPTGAGLAALADAQRAVTITTRQVA